MFVARAFMASAGANSSVPVINISKFDTLLLPGTGTNNTNNNTFRDSSSNNFTITRTGNTTQGTFTPYSDAAGYWSNYFSGANFLSIANNAALNFDTGAFTIEAWIYPTSISAAALKAIVGKWSPGDNWLLVLNNTNNVRFYYNQSLGAFLDSTATIVANQWTHIAVSRDSSNNLRIYVNGVNSGSAANVNYNSSTTSPVTIGAYANSSYFTGYISNVRIVKGSAVYSGTSSFTPPTAPLTAIVNTSLLTGQSNRFVDNSTNAFAITSTGSPRVDTFGPFTPIRNYSTSVVGGSVYFDGTGDYLTTALSSNLYLPNSQDWTVELFACPANFSALQCIFFNSQAGTGWTANSNIALYLDTSGRLIIEWSNGTATPPNMTGTTSSVANTWNHIAMVYDGTAKTITTYVNGVRDINAANFITYAPPGTTPRVTIGRTEPSNPTPVYPYTGYMSNVRVVRGSKIYTGATLSVPTAPLTAVSGTSLLLSGTNAAIYDTAMSTVLETVGDAKVSTTVSAGGSMYFDGTGDYLTTPSGPNVQYGTGDFTIEWWQYSANVTGAAQRGVFQTSTTAGGLATNYTTGIMFVQGSNGVSATNGACAANIMGTYVGTSSVVLTANTWQHIAITRSSGTCRVFVNGTQVASATVATAINANNLAIGGYYNASYLYVGYLQDFRMSKGFARYTSAFTPPARST